MSQLCFIVFSHNLKENAIYIWSIIPISCDLFELTCITAILAPANVLDVLLMFHFRE